MCQMTRLSSTSGGAVTRGKNWVDIYLRRTPADPPHYPTWDPEALYGNRPGSKRSMATRRNAHALRAELLLRGHVIRRWAVL